MHSSIISPEGIWWKPVPRQEKIWIGCGFIWCMILFAMMPLWHIKGGQNPAGIRRHIKPADFEMLVEQCIEDYGVDYEYGIPIIYPPAGSDIYLLSKMWSWYPILKLDKGKSYRLHLSSVDVNHGFSLYPVKINLQVLPGYDYGLKIKPNSVGDYRIICNEFCGIGHHLMVGKILVI